MRRRVRAAVVGTGWWSTAAHLPALAGHPDVDLVAVCDIVEAKAKRTASLFGGVPFTNVDEMFGEMMVDVVVVATPQDAHQQPALTALRAGADVLIEKPMVLRASEAIELVEVAASEGRRLHVGYPYLYTPHVRWLREALHRGDFGEVHQVTGLFATAMTAMYRGEVHLAMNGTPEALFAPEPSTYADPGRGGGQAYSQMTHALGLLLHLLSPTIVDAAVGISASHGAPVDVSDGIVMSLSNGGLAVVSSTGVVPFHAPRFEEYRIFGAVGHIALETGRGLCHFWKDGRTDSLEALDSSDRYPLHAPAQRLIDVWLGKCDVLVSGELGIEVARVLDFVASDAARDPTNLHQS